MKKAAIAMLVASSLGLSACQQPAEETTENQTVEFTSEEQKQAYAIGASVGDFVKQRLSKQEELGLPVDRDMIVKGFVDAVNDQSQLDKTEMMQLSSAQEKLIRDAEQTKAAEMGEENIAKGQAFLEENAKKEGVQVTESGLQYMVMEEAEGPKPAATDTVKVHYKGTLLDGREFDSSYSRGEPAVFPLNRVIAGWTEGVQLMSVGSKYKFFIPSDLAYGARSTGIITSHSTLVFEVELLEIVGQPAEATE